MFIESEFGWLVSGRAETKQHSYSIVCHANTSENLDTQIEKFWKIEELQGNNYSLEEHHCEHVFNLTTSRDETGRYIVQLPRKPDFSTKLGLSKASALGRFDHLERRLDRDHQLKEEYHKFMQEYLTLGHMQPVDDDINTQASTYYLPHHPVIKETSTTTKVRVVFNGSAPTSTEFSLNEVLCVGPVVQDDLFSIVLRFRTYPVALVRDIEKMYRQVFIHPDDRSLQRILFRFTKEAPVQTYELNTVTYGLSPSPFLATRTFQQLATDEGGAYALGGPALENSFYVDDYIGGANSIEEAIQLRRKLSNLLGKGGLVLRKWASNQLKVVQGPSKDQIGTKSNLEFSPNEAIKTLGIGWEPEADLLHFDSQVTERTEPNTKRSILSDIAKLFDPLGLVAPVVVKAKILMQQLWLLTLRWDAVVPATIDKQWKEITHQLQNLSKLRIERYAFLPNSRNELHCFVDASTLAYGACLYARSISTDDIKVRLLTAKSRVAPLKRITLPRLELCAALLGAQLYEKISCALTTKPINVVFWSDCTVVLHWLQASPHTWKTFVANRVSEIQALTHKATWFHVSGLENSADLVSRGLLPDETVYNQLWFDGPTWLANRSASWPTNEQLLDLPRDVDLEMKTTKVTVQAHLKKEINPIFLRYSSYQKLITIVAYCFRFILNATNIADRPTQIALSVEERHRAVCTLVQTSQSATYPEEIKQLRKTPPT